MKLPKPIRKLIAPIRNRLKMAMLYFRKSDFSSKIFCIGYNKTGTSSLGTALSGFGFKHSSFNRIIYRNFYLKKKYDKIIWYTSKFESFDDLPWLKEDMIPKLDKAFPSSKFIYLHREEEDWIKSFESYSLKKKGIRPNMKKELLSYKKHERFVREYFKNWPENRFIELNIKDDLGAKKLSKFLSVKKPIESFPHKNKTADFKRN
ncbi:MAG TPA: sulfotransferase [Fulvivirga sp.]|nr:sulfotransferase [Fulvivirga sp.]